MGDQVIVETAQGPEFATCTEGNHEVEDSAIVKPLSPVLRMATDSDRRTVEQNKKRESEAFDICEKKIAAHGLEMKLVNVSASFDGNKIIFYFTADGRVDFRELVRDLAGGVPGPDRAAADRRPGRGQDDRRSGDLRQALLLLPVSGRVPARVHQNGQDPEPEPESHQDLRHLRAADVLPEVRAERL